MQHHKSKKEKRKKLEEKKSGSVDVSDPGKIEAPVVSKNPPGPMEHSKRPDAGKPDTDGDAMNDADMASDPEPER